MSQCVGLLSHDFLEGWLELTLANCSTVASIESDAFDIPAYDQGTEGPDRKIDFSIGLLLSDQDKMDLFRSRSAVNPTLHSAHRDQADWRRHARGAITTVTLAPATHRKTTRVACTCWAARKHTHTRTPLPCGAGPRLEVSILRGSSHQGTASFQKGLYRWLYWICSRRICCGRCTPILDALESE
jgi:hypothetical protein